MTDHREPVTQGHPITDRVRGFYEAMPFNYYSSSEAALARLEANPIETYPDLDALLCEDSVKTVLEIGCGAGWATNAMARHYGKHVTGVDMTQRALERAQEVARLGGTGDFTRFVRADLFDFQPETPADVTVSIGVLHHTRDCRMAFDHVAGFVPPGGYLFVGLYHLYGRRVFLKLFSDIVAASGEDAAFDHYRRLNPALQDESHLRSWFRDQVLHPHETQHTLEEVMHWLDAAGLDLESTSINRFGAVDDRAALILAEVALEALSWQRNVQEERYFPGFFTVLCRRPE